MNVVDAERWHKAKELASAALALSGSARTAFVMHECAGDPWLRRAVTDFLDEGDGHDAAFLTPPQGQSLEALCHAILAADLVGQKVGAYRVTDVVAAGGMGTVYLGERDDETYRKRVAIKLVHAHPGDPLWLRRFQRERQALAVLEHPGITRLIDGGMTDGGCPYLVMEYVEGEPIDAYCTARNLGVRERLAMFRRVCEAVQHAHQNLIVHRDLKPANILVAAGGQPKLLDFGIAALLDAAEDCHARPATQTGWRPYTPRYASPEQLRGEAVGMATDVYSLGVILYELLVGEPPFGRSSTSDLEHARRVCELDPAPPSAAAPKLARQLRGDIDNVVLMAMRKEPTRRYSTVREFADDVWRVLEHRPVLARPNTWRYRTGKLIRRNKLAAIGFSLGAAALLAGTVGTSVGLVRARRAGHEAISQRRLAESREADAHAVTAFLQETLAAANPFRGGYSATVDALLADASRRIELELAGQPRVEAGVRLALARTFAGLWRWPEAAEHAGQALSLFREQFGEDDPRVADCLSIIGRERTFAHDPISVSLQEEALDLRLRLWGRSDSRVAESLGNLGYALWHGLSDPRWAEAERHYRQAIQMYEEHGARYTNDCARFSFSLAVMLRVLGRYDEAEQEFAGAAGIFRHLSKSEDRYRFECLIRYASLSFERGRLRKAESLLREADGLLTDRDGREANLVRWMIGDVLHSKGEHAAGASMLIEALRREIVAARAAHPDACAWDELPPWPDAPKTLGEAVAAVRQATACLAALTPDRAWCFVPGMVRTGRALCREGHHEAAESVFHAARQHAERCPGPASRWSAMLHTALANCLIHQHRDGEARLLLHETGAAWPSVWEDERRSREERATLVAALAKGDASRPGPAVKR